MWHATRLLLLCDKNLVASGVPVLHLLSVPAAEYHRLAVRGCVFTAHVFSRDTKTNGYVDLILLPSAALPAALSSFLAVMCMCLTVTVH